MNLHFETAVDFSVENVATIYIAYKLEELRNEEQVLQDITRCRTSDVVALVGVKFSHYGISASDRAYTYIAELVAPDMVVEAQYQESIDIMTDILADRLEEELS